MNRSFKSDGHARKKSKLDDNTAHLYPPLHGEDDVSYSRNVELLQNELEKAKPRNEVLKDLMCRTFPNRWGTFINSKEPGSLLEYLSQFPVLKKASFVCLHCILYLL